MMSFIIVIFGASGSGKTTLIEELSSAGKAGKPYSIHIKGTDRPRRKYDDIEIKCVSSVEPPEYDYVYETYGHHYGIQASQIREAQRTGKHHFIICNDVATIVALRREYGENVKVIFYMFDAPEETLVKIQRERNITDDEINLRILKTVSLYRTYIDEHELFDGMLKNHYGDSSQVTLGKVEQLIQQLSKAPNAKLINPVNLQEIIQLVQSPTTVPKPPCDAGLLFVILAMCEDAHMEDCYVAIDRACDKMKLRAQKADELSHTGEITTRVLSHIKLAEFVVADLTMERPNVYYEVGYADALDKTLLLFAKEGTKIHFDLQGRPIKFYKSYAELTREVILRVEAHKSRINT